MASDGSEIRFINTVPGTTVKGLMRRVREGSCSNATIASTYRFETSGFPIWWPGVSVNGKSKAYFDVPFATTGITVIQADGSASWADAWSLGGMNAPRTYNVPFSLNADCTGTGGLANIYVSVDGAIFVMVSSQLYVPYTGWFDRQK